jgi:hypothetical protein
MIRIIVIELMLNKLFAGSRPTLKQSLFIGGGIGAASTAAIDAHNALNSDAIALEQDANTLGITPEQLLGLAGLAGVTGMLSDGENEILRTTTSPDMGGVAYTDPMTESQRLEAIGRNLQRINADVPRDVLVRRRSR